jgi:hypothetical protein
MNVHDSERFAGPLEAAGYVQHAGVALWASTTGGGDGVEVAFGFVDDGVREDRVAALAGSPRPSSRQVVEQLRRGHYHIGNVQLNPPRLLLSTSERAAERRGT